MILDLKQFVQKERPTWEALERQLTKLESPAYKAQGVDASWHLRQLISRTSSDLVRLRTYASDPELELYLEQLLARAHSAMNPPGRSRIRFVGLIMMLLTGFPKALRRHFKYLVISTTVFLLGSAVGGGFVFMDSEAKGIVMPFSHLLQNPEDRVADEETEDLSPDSESKAVFSAQLMTHNIRVSFFVFAAGFIFGIGTLYLLFYNGIILGAVVVDYVVAGQTTFLVGWLLPHGSVEIPAVLIAGQAGLLLGSSILGTGKFGKGMSIGDRIRFIREDLLLLLGGICMLLVWAGIVEAFLSQTHEPAIPYAVKIGIGLIELALLALYLLFAGKGVARE